MGSTSTPTVLTGRTSDLAYLGGSGALVVRVSFTMSNSYATGGDPLALPTNDVKASDLDAVVLMTRHDGTRTYDWNGSTTAPKILARSAFATEVTAATDLSAVTLQALLIYKR